MTSQQTDLQEVVKALQKHLTALRELDENHDREVAVDHLYKLAATANGAAETLKQRSDAAEQTPASGKVKGVSEELKETTDKNVEHVEKEMQKPLEQLTKDN